MAILFIDIYWQEGKKSYEKKEFKMPTFNDSDALM